VFDLQVMEDTISRLHRARQEEKRLRRSFQSSSGSHFVTTLFPELQDRLPDITVIIYMHATDRAEFTRGFFLSTSFIPLNP
jgi:DNA-binding transcriptional LysR family regulator